MKEILAITRCTIKELARSYHYKLLFLFLSVVLQVSYVFAAMYQTYFTVRSPNLGYNGTQFVVGNVDSTHFFLLQFVVVALTLVHSERLRGSDVMETIHAKRYRNICWTTGSLLGISTLVYVIPLVNFIVIYGVSLLGEVFDLDFGPSPEPMSVLNLIFVDVPVTIVFYGALAMVFHQILRSRMLVGVATLAVAFLHLVLIQSVPFNWRELVSYSTTHSVLVSEILPYFSNALILFNRLVWIVVAVGLCVVAALLDSRRDVLRPRYGNVALACIGVAIAGFFVHGFVLNREFQEAQRVASTHRISPKQDQLELTKISGKVEIDPGIRLLVDVDLSVRANDQSLDSLQFSFNPGMVLEHVRVDEMDRDYFFVDGLLTIPLSTNESTNNVWIVSIRGKGVPDVNFGYPDPERDYLGTLGTSAQMPKLLGMKNSIFDHRYVALMPGIRWYPVPLPLGIDKSVQSMQTPVDTYFVDLEIHIANKNWKLAAPERLLLASGDSIHYQIQSSGEVPHFAIVTSEFQSRTVEAGEVEMELLIHSRHFEQTESKTAIWNLMMGFITERLSDLSDAGLPFPYRSLTLVEVPNHLRLVGGYDMPFLYSQPGVVLMRESGFPTAKMDEMYERYLTFDMTDDQRQQYVTENIFFYDYTNILGGNLLCAVAEQYFPFMDSPLVWEGLALIYMKRMLLIDIMMGPDDSNIAPSDITLVEEIAGLTAIYPSFVFDRIFRTYEQPNPTRLEGRLYNRFMKSNASFVVQTLKMSEMLQSNDVSLRRAAVEQRLSDTYRALVELYGNAKLHDLLDQESKRVANHSRSHADTSTNRLKDSSKSLIPLMSEWHESTHAPAFSTSGLDIVRVAVQDAPFTHRASFKIRNDADITGVVEFYTDHYLDSKDTGICIEVPGQTAFHINLYTEEEIEGVIVSTFYSENQGGFYVLPVRMSGSDPEDILVEKPLPTITEISWDSYDQNTVIVDNLDPGFRLVDWEIQSESRAFQNLRWFWEPPPLQPIRAMGLDGFTWNKLKANKAWRIMAAPWSNTYGRYRPTALATFGTDVETARFSAELPIGGKWSLSYHFPTSYGLVGRFGVHNFVLHDAQRERQIQVDPKDGSGWIHAEEFDLSSSTVHLDLVSVDPPNSLRVADAVRWKLVSKNND